MPTSLRTVDVNKIELTDLSVTTGAAGASALAYDNTTGGFTFTPVNMNGLTDVDTTGVTQGQTLLYDSGTSSWIVGDSVGGLAASNTETDNVKSTLAYDSGTGTFTFDFGNDFSSNGVRTDSVIPASGTVTVSGNVFASADQTHNMGNNITRWNEIHAMDIYGYTRVTTAELNVQTITNTLGPIMINSTGGATTIDDMLITTNVIQPQTTGTQDIGTTSLRWNNIYANTIDAATNVNSAALSVTGLSTLTGGLLANGEIQVGVTASNEIDTVSANLILDSATGLTQVDDDMQVTGSLTVTGDLTINGTSTTVNSTTITVDDPVFTLGGDTAPASNDALDKGIEFKWHDGAAAKVGFFGYDESAGKFTFIADATNTSETFTGTAGDVVFGAGSFTTVTASTSLGVGNDWTVALNGANLQFLYQGTVVAQIDSTGQIDALQDVIADSTSL